MTPKYPKIRVQLSGEDGNAFFILARALRAARGKLSQEEIDAFTKEARSGNYDHLLQTCMAWFDCH